MDPRSTSPHKNTAVRGVQMLMIWFMMNLGLTIIGLLIVIQFFWMLFANERNGLIADVGITVRQCCSEAISFLLASSEYKPFP